MRPRMLQPRHCLDNEGRQCRPSRRAYIKRERIRRDLQATERSESTVKNGHRKNFEKSKFIAGLNRPALVDVLNADFSLPVKRREKFYEAPERHIISDFQRNPRTYRGYNKPGIYSSNDLCMVRSKKFNHCFNKTMKIFGISPKDRHWVALIRCIVCSGYTRKDFRSIMRIRDLKFRGKLRAYRGAVTSFIAHLPSEHVARALPMTLERSRMGNW